MGLVRLVFWNKIPDLLIHDCLPSLGRQLENDSSVGDIGNRKMSERGDQQPLIGIVEHGGFLEVSMLERDIERTTQSNKQFVGVLYGVAYDGLVGVYAINPFDPFDIEWDVFHLLYHRQATPWVVVLGQFYDFSYFHVIITRKGVFYYL